MSDGELAVVAARSENCPTHKANVGAAFGAAHFDVYGYNGRSELTAADRWTGTGPDDANKQDVAGDYGYAYDPIGNRLSYDPAGANTVYYCANSLNQYTTTDDAATCPPSTPAQSFAYDEDGNLVYEEGGSLATPRAYVYDAENRLIQVGPAGSPAVGDRRVTFTYDYRGRRVKQVGETWSGSGWISELRLFVWDDWKMLLERRLAQVGQPPPTRAYTWGLDLSGQRTSGRGGRLGAGLLLEGAGTIGGLLAVADGTGGAGTLTYVYCYDANGNVGQVVDPAAANVTAALVATYEYDPYGGVAASAGAYAATNPVRFSTKYWDDATGLGYWGYRFYRADLGRWVNRDPIGERGGRNLLAYVLNAPSRFVDRLGLCIACSPGWGAGPEHPSPPETLSAGPVTHPTDPCERAKVIPSDPDRREGGEILWPGSPGVVWPGGTPGATVCDGKGGFVGCVDRSANQGYSGQQPKYVKTGPGDKCPDPPTGGPPKCNTPECNDLMAHCVCKHEQWHIDDFQRFFPNACEGKGPGEHPDDGAPDTPEGKHQSACDLAWLEFRAWNDTLHCLTRNTGGRGSCYAQEKDRAKAVWQKAYTELMTNCPLGPYTPPDRR